ncbi:hypothetical protein FOA43_002965 [Brettanomyces nanus]|uniref:N-acetyltransferase domain-containing protein n=1 Tax=Eeniella nana TaxID=13502 RepID=A0A875S3S4_EENNA|nr:uncharacterized protein FOA43_002965 [Brettanomyces nanus]QPG75608.1 hypothetical protein FOA43_002965 [Brettanomyces nanus]
MTITYSALSLDTSEKSRGQIDGEIEAIRKLVNEHLSEPYSVYVYRFFLNNWPELCLLAKSEGNIIGCIISKVETHRNTRLRGYIGMLTVTEQYRGQGIAKKLIDKSLDIMVDKKCDEIILETEVVNKKALRLYENFGFVRVKRLYRYYLNKHDAYRLILPITDKACLRSTFLEKLPEEKCIEARY